MDFLNQILKKTKEKEKRMYTLKKINKILENELIHDRLVEYCEAIANKYRETNDGNYMIKYNDLYRILYNCLSDDKKVEFFNSFANSIDIFPIIKVTSKKILLRSF